MNMVSIPYSLKTIDVWDTLIRRRSHPDCSKLFIAQHIALYYADRLNKNYPNAWSIYKARCLVEGQLVSEKKQKHLDGEYTISEVYERLIQCIFISPLPTSLVTLVNTLVECEFTFEKDNTYACPYIEDFIAQYPAHKTLFLSDFYMPKEHLTELLGHLKLDHLLPDGGVVSCDIGLNKRSGQLFKHVHKALSIKPEHHIHIGDNLHADVDVPNKMQITSVAYQPLDAHQQRLNNEKRFIHRQSLLNAINHDITLLTPTHQLLMNTPMSAFTLGKEMSGLFVGFALFIAEESIKQRLSNLLFMTREGEFFKTVFDTLFPTSQHAGHHLPKTALVEVSRLSTFSASLSTGSIDEMMRVWRLYSSQSMAALLTTLGINPKTFNGIIKKHRLDLYTTLQYPWQDKRVIALFKDPIFQAKIRTRIETAKANFSGYITETRHFNQEGTIGLVDIGWRGTIQDNIAHQYPEKNFSGFYLGLAKFLNPQPDNSKKQAFAVDLNQHNQHDILLNNVSLIEMLANSPSGSVIDYEIDKQGAYIAKRAISAEENDAYFNYSRHFQAGVIEAAKVWRRYIHSDVLMSDEIKANAIQHWFYLTQQTPDCLANVQMQLHHNETFGIGQYITAHKPPKILTLLSAFFNKTHRIEVIRYICLIQTPSIIFKAKDFSLLTRILWSATIYAGLKYKHLRNRLMT